MAMPPARQVLPSYAIGVGLSMALEAAAPRGVLGDVSWAAMPAAILLALVLRIGAAGITVVVAVSIHKGLPIPAALLLTGVAAYMF
jgi:hypothetical protein